MFSNYQIGNSQLRLAFGVPGRTGAHTLRQQSNSVGLNELGPGQKGGGGPGPVGGPGPYPPKPHYQKPYDRQGGGRGGIRPQGGDTRKCFNCGEPGHMAKDCSRNRGGNQGGNQRGPDTRTCYNCNERGHVARDCPRNQGGPNNRPPNQPRFTAPGFQQPPPQPPMHPAPGHPPMVPGMPGLPGMPMPPMMPGMPPMVAQYPTAGAGAVYPPGYTVASQIGAPQMVAPPQMAAAYAPPSVSMSAPGPPGVAVSAAPTVQHATTATPVYHTPIAHPAPQPTASQHTSGVQHAPPLQPPGQSMLGQSAAAAAVSHQPHLPIQPQQPAPSPVPDNTAQLLQLQGQIQQAAQQVQLLGQQAATAYSQAQQAPTNELRNQYYQQYTQLYQQQQQHQQTHNNLVSQHTALLRGAAAPNTSSAAPTGATTGLLRT